MRTANMTPLPANVEGGSRMRARYPDHDGHVEQGGVKLFYEVYGEGNDPTVLLAPLAWPVLHSRMWKAQIPYLARYFRVVTYDPRGNGRSDRPVAPEEYGEAELVADALAVLEAARVDRFVMATYASELFQYKLAADHPDQVLGIVSIHTCLPALSPPLPQKAPF